MTKLRIAAAAVIGATLALSGSSAFAGSKIFASFNSYIYVNGTLETTANSNRDPFVVQVFSAGSECLRIAVASQGADLEATLVSPSGQVWQDDDSNGSLRPLIKALTTFRGWYPLVISTYNGAAVNADFSFYIHRLASLNSACSPQTPVRISNTAGAKSGGTGAAPAGGTN